LTILGISKRKEPFLLSVSISTLITSLVMLHPEDLMQFLPVFELNLE
jgi:hypothetical protein